MERPESVNGVEVPYGASVAELESVVAVPSLAAWAAAIALAHNPTEAACQALVRLGTHGDWRIRRVAIEALGIHRSGSSAAKEIIAAMSDTNQSVAIAACAAVDSQRILEAHDRLVAMLADHREDIRVAAVRALASVWELGDQEAVLRMYRSDESRAVRDEAAWTLKENAEALQWAALFEAWVDAPLARHRSWACELFGEFGDLSARPRVEALLQDENGHVRKAAARALANEAMRSKGLG